jgi:lipoprotein-releasing system permease protein
MTHPPSGQATLFKLAWRNLWRHGRRTLLLVVVVAYATLAIIFFWGFTDGFFDAITTGQARYVAAPVLISTPAYHEDPDPSNALPALPALTGAAPRLEFAALLQTPSGSGGAGLRGVEPALEERVSNLPGDVAAGRMLAAPGEIVLGRGLAAALGVGVGERVAVNALALAGPQRADLRVVGLIGSGVSFVDGGTALLHIADARRLTGVSTATALALDAPRGREQALARRLNATGPNATGPSAELPEGVRAYPVQQLLGPLQEGLAAERLQMIPMGLIFSLFAAVAVMSTVLLTVMERTREFGVLTALGLDQHRLARLVTLEALLTTFLGFLAGAALGYALNWALATWNVLGPLFSGLFGPFLENFAVTDEIYTALDPAHLGYAALTVLLAGVLSALVPGRRVRRLNPAEAMRAS